MRQPWPKVLIAIAAIGVVAAASIYFYVLAGDRGQVLRPYASHSISINGHRLDLEVAMTSAQQEKGLGERDSLAPDTGMIFPFEKPSRPGFWMKGMRFPLDFIYVRDAKIVELRENIYPNPMPTPFFPSEDVDAIIEVNAGWVAAHGVRVGDEIGPSI